MHAITQQSVDIQLEENLLSNEDSMVCSKKKRVRKIQEPLKIYYEENPAVWEIGVDEAGRGPLFGRVYAAAVILPKDDTFEHSQMKDSKKFHSQQKIEQVAEYIKEKALAWYVAFEDEKTIEEINILQATQKCMHTCIGEIMKQMNQNKTKNKEDLLSRSDFHLLIDGNYFNPITSLNKTTKKLEILRHTTVEGGDNQYTCIAAASILAKVERDRYIQELCSLHPELSEKYGIDSNKGYGAKRHLDGIKQHGITQWHRKTFGICKSFV